MFTTLITIIIHLSVLHHCFLFTNYTRNMYIYTPTSTITCAYTAQKRHKLQKKDRNKNEKFFFYKNEQKSRDAAAKKSRYKSSRDK